jgi:D-glycero-alpha-D-manno-heptose-7-phosphate kinase
MGNKKNLYYLKEIDKMIICRTPLRISLFGGGLDYPEWFNKNRTNVLNFTINQYTYLSLRKIKNIHNYNFRLRYHKTEEVNKVNHIQHNSFREIIKKYLKKNHSIEITYTADLPALSGLGSSSSSTVGAINALNIYNNINLGKRDLAEKAIYMERNILRENVGFQDQIASAFGGINNIELYNNNFTVNPIYNKNFLKELNNNFYIYFTGMQRLSNKIEEKKIKKIKINNDKFSSISNKIININNEAIKTIMNNFNIKKINELINLNWYYKKKLNPECTNPKIDNMIRKILDNGASSARLVGSGNGGFILFYCNKNKINNLKKKINKSYLINFKVDFSGSQIVFNSNFTD